ncbi:hypothetical protein [Sphingomonas sp. Leaf242]|uniref:hypothetical protein n=1 Tax=Sphingomonas sp. Leaf242 TaxID=1736304 RepID=UPI00071452E4|nr:hypothetical protein [Sphingomonas sp. Leaf242]KQO09421.1 hypothetical protein ASF09_07295 [Sphingomonas sp. Leaf242]
MTRLVLTIPQARALQRSDTPWPAEWAFMLVGEREKPDTTADDTRTAIGMAMKARGCENDQIAEQLGWKPESTPVKQIARLHRILAAS